MTEENVWIISPTGEMKPGFYKTKLVKKGPYVPVWLEEIRPEFGDDGKALADFAYRLKIGTKERDALTAKELSGEPITEGEYRFLLARAAYAIEHEPDMPDANPRQPVDFNKLHFSFGS